MGCLLWGLEQRGDVILGDGKGIEGIQDGKKKRIVG